MKILIYIPYTAWVPHFATDLEIAAKHINKGDEVHIIQCSGDLPSCEPNPNHYKLSCYFCKSRRDKGLNIINLPKQNRHELELHSFTKDRHLPDFTSMQELKSFEIDNIDFGMAVASTLISMVREPSPNIDHYTTFIRKNLSMSIAVYNAIKHHLNQIRPDIFYLFNGRFAATRPALRAAQNLGINTFVHDRAGVLQRYMLTENTYPHDIEYQQQQIEITWNDKQPHNEKEAIANQWFEDRVGGKSQGWHSYTKSQKKGNLPEGFDPSKRNIAIYISSQDEFEAIQGWKNPIYNNQNDAIRSITHSDIDSDLAFYIRIHPNLKGLNNTQTQELQQLHAPNLTIIPADATIDSYELMNACEKIIVFGSTMGIESVYWGKPSILIGRSLYENLGGCYNPKNHDEVVNLINKHLEPLPKRGALKFGYWQSVYGLPFEYYSPESVRSGKFMGVYLGNPMYDKLKDKVLAMDRISPPLINFVRRMRKWTWQIRSYH